MHRQSGFSLIEVMITVAIVSILVVMVVSSQQSRGTKAQVMEAMAVFDTQRIQVAYTIAKENACSLPSDTSVSSKYGASTVTGAVNANAIANPKKLLKTGCILTFTFNTSARSVLANKRLAVDIFNNGTLSKAVTTTINQEFIPKQLKTQVEDP